jgi:putative Holliday junction resolvase
MLAMTLLGVDWGRRRIGLAIKPAGQDWPLPSQTLTTGDEREAMDGLREAILRSGAQGVVVGLPLHPDPAQAREIKRFCRKTRQAITGVRWFFVDESLSTKAAEDLAQAHPLSAGRLHRTDRPSDDLAAAIILETFIQSCP